MANQMMNIARGKIGYYLSDALGLAPANSRLVIIALEAAEADDVLNNYDDIAALLAQPGNTEATSTGYARIEIDDTGITYSVDDTANTAKVVIDADQTWSAISQATTESWVKLIYAYDDDNAAGTDANLVPLGHVDFAVTPNGGDITADFDQTNGIWASS